MSADTIAILKALHSIDVSLMLLSIPMWVIAIQKVINK